MTPPTCAEYPFRLLLLAMALSAVRAAAAEWDCSRTADGTWACDTSNRPAKTAESISKPVDTGRLPVSVEPPVAAPPAPAATVPPPAPTTPVAPPPTTRAAASPAPWSCSPGADGNWNCANVGQGARTGALGARAAAALEAAIPGDPAYAPLIARLPANPWGQCAEQRLTPLPRQADGTSPGPPEIFADAAEVDPQGRTHLSGNVEVKRGGQTATADRADYDPDSSELQAEGGVLYNYGPLVISSERGHFNLDRQNGAFSGSHFIVATRPGRGTAQTSTIDNASVSRHHKVSYTSCPPGRNDWLIRARDFTVDRDANKGIVRHGTVSFGGIPLLYSPYFSFPLDGSRVSGLLTPSVGYTNRLGLDLTVPYYFNLAPNYDLTLYPRVLSRRGFLLGSDFRYLSERSAARLEVQGLPHDTTLNQPRGQLLFRGDTAFTEHLFGRGLAQYVSDRNYFTDLAGPLGNTTTRQLESEARLTYSRDNFLLYGRAQNFQTIDLSIPPNLQPYRRIPQLYASYNDQLPGVPLAWTLTNEFANFDRGTGITGARFDINPRISAPLRGYGAFLTPSASFRHTEYFLTDVGQPRDTNRTVPTLSVDSGVVLDREVTLGGRALTQTLEPRLYYLYVPRVEQNGLPLFESSELDFTFNQLFRENRFAGVDRVGDANQLATAVTTRFEDAASGRELAAFRLGNIFYFSPPTVGLTRDLAPTGSYSNIVAEATGVYQHWTLQAAAQWNPQTNQNDRTQLALRYVDENVNLFKIGYRFRRNVVDPVTLLTSSLISPTASTDPSQLTNINQTDVGLRLPITDTWRVLGRWVYSWRDRATLDSFVGFEKETCCLRLTMAGRRFVIDRFGNSTTGVFVQLELKGLNSFGDPIDNFLRGQLDGYYVKPR